jgi:hypothetical protein
MGRNELTPLETSVELENPVPAASSAEALYPLFPINEHRPDDIFIVGYPKSGNTWVQNLVAAAFCGVQIQNASDALVQELVPDVSSRKIYQRRPEPMFFKSHSLPTAAYKRVIYLLRDGRDVMVSYLHHLRALLPGPIDFLDLVRTGRFLFPCKWHEHVRQWWPNPFSARFLVVRYEHLKRDPVCELKRICSFVGREPGPHVLEAAVRQSAFEAMQERENRLGWQNAAWPKDKPFIRRGIVGSHADEMPPEVQAAFLQEAGPLLKEVGYLSDWSASTGQLKPWPP